MQLAVLDFETYYGDDFTLSKMTTESYVRDTRFEVIGVGVTFPETGQRAWMEEAQFRRFAAQYDWSQAAVLCHHAHFDGLILSHHYGARPGYWLDTLSMGRAIHGAAAGNSLAALMLRYGVGEKGTEVINAKGKHRVDFTPEEWRRYGAYCLNDCDGTLDVFRLMAPGYPHDELDLIDITVRMFTEPALVLDEPVMREYLEYETQRKEDLLTRIGADKKTLSSGDKFATLLQEYGVEPPTKLNPKGKTIYAFAKTDPGMQELLEDESEDVRWLCEARVAVKSTGNQTRTQRMLNMGAGGRALPVYLKYAGAHTLRWSGADGVNWQNFERTNKKNPRKGMIRKSVRAPEGWLLVGGDASQIEARFNAWFSDEAWLIEAFRQGQDVYSLFGSEIYRRPIDRKNNPADELPGHVGKTCFAAGTLVVTSRGTIPIESITIKDLLWDGAQWVAHAGVLCLGEKEVVRAYGLAATADHEILTERGWQEWSAVRTNRSLFRSALRSASLPLSGGRNASNPTAAPAGGIQLCGALVVEKALLIAEILSAGHQRGVTCARKKPPRANGIGNMKPLWRMLRTASGFLTGYLPRLTGVTPPATVYTSTTVEGVSTCAVSGGKTKRRFFGMCRHSLGGTFRRWIWTGQTTTAGTSPETFASLQKRRAPQTSGALKTSNSESETSRKKTKVYDIANAGPKHRYTVVTSAGPVIVHNCVLGLGYQMGWLRFGAEVLKGANGAPPIKFARDDLNALGIDPRPFLANPKNVERIEATPSRLPMSERLIHFTVAHYVVDIYRKKNARIAANWKFMAKVIDLMAQGYRGQLGKNGLIELVENGIRLPSGMVMHYHGLRKNDANEYVYLAKRGQIAKLHGGVLTENWTQAATRIIVADAMRRLHKDGLKIVSSEHDAVIGCCPAADAPYWSQRLLQEIATPPSWAPDIPLAAEGGFGVTLAETK